MESSILNWRKSSYSGGNGGSCVEVANADHVLVRDTADRTGPVLRFTPGAWRRFAVQVKRSLASEPDRAALVPVGRGRPFPCEPGSPEPWSV